MANVLVTGGTGQIGTYVCSELSAQGHRVFVFDFKPNETSFLKDTVRPEVLVGDVSNLDELLNAIKTKQITHIIHLAAVLVFESKLNPFRAIRVNTVGTNNVFEAARLSDVQRIVFTSSVSVYGSKQFFPKMIVNEDDFPHCPPDPYSITKLSNELMCDYYRQTYGIDLLCLRLTAAWGPGRYTGYTGQFNDFIRRAALGERAELPADFAYRDTKLRWFYVKEMSACIAFSIFVGKNKIKRGLYNIGRRVPFKALDVVRAIETLIPLSNNIYFKETNEPTKLSSDIAGPSGLDVDCSRLYDELGFVESMNLKEATSDMINFERTKGK